MKLLLLNASTGPDYLADLFIGEMISSKTFEISTNYLGNYLFDDYPDKYRLYGRGYTAFTKLKADLKQDVHLIDHDDLLRKLTSKYFDRVIYTSIWRHSDLINEVLQLYKKEQIIVLDGEDHTNVYELAKFTEYYKRELIPSFSEYCKPISFAFPSFVKSNTLKDVKKTQLLAPCIPGMRETYVYQTEEDYYLQYSESYFGLTTKKAGWDCMRHYEIINANCIPYFPDILEKPEPTMAKYPLTLQYRANELFQFLVRNPNSMDANKKSMILSLADAFGQWLNDFGTTRIYREII